MTRNTHAVKQLIKKRSVMSSQKQAVQASSVADLQRSEQSERSEKSAILLGWRGEAARCIAYF